MPSEKARIYHNPRCSKSRETLALLRENDFEPDVVLYLEAPPSERELRTLIEMLGVSPHDLLRTKEAPYVELGLSQASSADEIVAAIVKHPVLLERPIVVVGDKAVIGRPPERVLTLLRR